MRVYLEMFQRVPSKVDCNCIIVVDCGLNICSYRRGYITCSLYSSEVGEQKRMHADIKKWNETGHNKGIP